MKSASDITRPPIPPSTTSPTTTASASSSSSSLASATDELMLCMPILHDMPSNFQQNAYSRHPRTQSNLTDDNTETETDDGTIVTGRNSFDSRNSFEGRNSFGESGSEVAETKTGSKRGNYKCQRCNVPKKGHVCPYQPVYMKQGNVASRDRSTERKDENCVGTYIGDMQKSHRLSIHTNFSSVSHFN